MVNNSKAFKIAQYAIMFATIFVAMMLDKAIGFIPISFSMAVCVLLVTLSFCFLENKWSTAVLAGLFFGLASFIKEFIFPSPLLGQVLPAQYWIIVTIPSRVLMTTGAFGAYRFLLLCTGKITNARLRQIVCITVAALVGLVLNTVLFFSFLRLAKYLYVTIQHVTITNDAVWILIYGCLLTNIVPEYLVSLCLVALIVLGVRKGLKLGVDGNNWKRARADEKQAEQQRLEQSVSKGNFDSDSKQ